MPPARRTLREIKAPRPDFLVINGDFVDEASPADLALARRMLTEELGDELPWYYVPGNHEIMGPGTIDNFRREFGATYRSFDHKGTRFVLLDSSTGTLRGGGFDQIVLLRDALDAPRRQAGGLGRGHGTPPAARPDAGQGQPARPTGMEAGAGRALAGRVPPRHRQGRGVRRRPRRHVLRVHSGRRAVSGQRQLRQGTGGTRPGGFTGWTLLGVDAGKPEVARGRDSPARRHVVPDGHPTAVRLGAPAGADGRRSPRAPGGSRSPTR